MSNKECRYCKKSNLHWESKGGNWRLFDKYGEVHECIDYYLAGNIYNNELQNWFIVICWYLHELRKKNREVWGIGW